MSYTTNSFFLLILLPISSGKIENQQIFDFQFYKMKNLERVPRKSRFVFSFRGRCATCLTVS